MRRRRLLLTLFVGISAGAFVISTSAQVLAQARDDVERESAALDRTAAELRELSELRGQRELVSAAKRPTQDVIALVNAVLREAGIPTDRMKNLDPEVDAPLADRYRRQTLRLTLSHLSLRDVGSFLSRWREVKTVWVPVSVELTHVTAPDGGDLGFDARVVIAATYLSDAPSEPHQ